MTDWIFPADPEKYNVDEAFHTWNELDWGEVCNAGVKAGDRVFIYQNQPVSAVTHVCEVLRTGIQFSETIDDRECWRRPEERVNRPGKTWMRLRLTHSLEPFQLSSQVLKGAGLRGIVRGRRRAHAHLSKILDEIIKCRVETAAELIKKEQNLLSDMGYPKSTWRYQNGGRGGASSYTSYEAALDVPGAAVALAMLRKYLTLAGLDCAATWAISALPAWSGPSDRQRFATVSGGRLELFYVWIEAKRGVVDQWGVRISNQQASNVACVAGVTREDATNGDLVVTGESFTQLLTFLNHRGNIEAIRATARERASTRVERWHNVFLAEFLLPLHELKDDPVIEPVSVEARKVARMYKLREVRERLHQKRLRRLALDHYPNKCHHCGIDQVEVIDAAHIIPDSVGGAADLKNIRLLCANHHRAYDGQLMIWDAEHDRFEPAPGRSEVPPLQSEW